MSCYVHGVSDSVICVDPQIVHKTRPVPAPSLTVRVFQSRMAQLVQALVWHPDFKMFLDLNNRLGKTDPTHVTRHKVQKVRDYIIECLQYHFPRIRVSHDREIRLLLQALGTILRGVPGGQLVPCHHSCTPTLLVTIMFCLIYRNSGHQTKHASYSCGEGRQRSTSLGCVVWHVPGELVAPSRWNKTICEILPRCSTLYKVQTPNDPSGI